MIQKPLLWVEVGKSVWGFALFALGSSLICAGALVPLAQYGLEGSRESFPS